MIKTHCNIEDFEKVSRDADLRKITVGRFFEWRDIEAAKNKKLFDDIRQLLKMYSDEGIDVHYICQEDKKFHGGGKWLRFALHGCDDNYRNTLLDMLVNVACGIKTDFNTLNPNISYRRPIMSGNPSGEPSMCPLLTI